MPNPHIRALGEIALKVSDLEKMQAFYADVIGLELLRRFPHAAFFKIAEGYAGHTQVLALFDRTAQPGYAGLSAAQTTIDHIAFTIAVAAYPTEKARLLALGLNVQEAVHQWVQWRSLYVQDPEGHQVELVCYDPTVV